MNAKRLKSRKTHRLPLKAPVTFTQKKEKHSAFPNESSSLFNDTAFYAVSRKHSAKRLNLLINESKKTRESLLKSEEKIRLFNHQLSCINQSTCSVIGNEYFENLVQSLASIFGMRYAFIGKIGELPV